MKKDSRDDNLDAEAHIPRLIRDMEDLHNRKGKEIWRDNRASSSLLPSSLYSHSVIATDAVTPYLGYIGRP